MPTRWIICPVDAVQVTDPESGNTATVHAPRVYWAQEPGRGKPHRFSAVIADPPGAFALCLVRANDFSAVEGAAFENALDGEEIDDATDLLALTPRMLGWNNNRLNRVRTKLSNRGIDTAGITMDTPFEVILDRLAEWVAPGARARRTRVA